MLPVHLLPLGPGGRSAAYSAQPGALLSPAPTPTGHTWDTVGPWDVDMMVGQGQGPRLASAVASEEKTAKQ